VETFATLAQVPIQAQKDGSHEHRERRSSTAKGA
jgi:hypothetical protein